MYAGSNPAVIVLILCYLFCRAVLESSGKKQGKMAMYAGSNPAVIVLILCYLFCRAVLEFSGKK
ncbi:hypothetical protein EFN40_03715 [Pediococcus parvulus]|nr:hypothetical protein [Pediococcus parvulus]